MMYKRLAFLFGACCLLVFFACATLSYAARSESPPAASYTGAISQDSTAPNWILSTPEGQTLSLYQLAKQGKTTVMVFWSSWCEECKVLLPALARLMQAQPSDSVQVVLLNVWENDDPQRYLKRLGVDFPLLLRGEAVARRYQISATPGVVIVDKELKVRYARPVRERMEDVLKRVTQLLPASGDDESPGHEKGRTSPSKT